MSTCLSPAILVKDVRKSFRRTEVLHGISLSVHPGEVVGLVGPSGCGKTTLIDLMVGLTVPTQGTVLLEGECAPFRTKRADLGYMPQDTALYEDITADENIAFFGSLAGLDRKTLPAAAERALALAHLQDCGKQMVGSFSGGMKRRLSLAIALLNSPRVLVADEPTVGLDPIHRANLWNAFHELARSGSALLVSTHIMDEAARCDRVIMMREGLIICNDTPDGIRQLTGKDNLEDAFILLAERENKGGEHHA